MKYEISKRLAQEICGGRCPACDSDRGFLCGPFGGLAQNVECKACGNRYNVLPTFGVEYIGRNPEATP